MKSILILLLLPIACFVSTGSKTIKTSENYNFELTVNSAAETPARFNLLITGVMVTEKGDHVAFKRQNKNLSTPFNLILKEGKYTVVIERRSRNGSIISSVQGINDGQKMGSASDDSKKTILEFGFGGNFSARGE